MTEGITDPTSRFSNRVTDYTRARPSYPEEVVAVLQRELGLGQGCEVADIGSGTGLFTSLLLETGCRVTSVEPNAQMREAAEARLASHPHFRSVAGTAEDTGLAGNSIDVVTAAQAFHWFDVDKCTHEFRRILRSEGWVALVWNRRRVDDSEFSAAYERFLETWGTGYQDVRASWDVERPLARFFGGGPIHRGSFPHVQPLDFEGLQARFLSSSYAPSRDDPNLPETSIKLRELFDDHAEAGTVPMIYDARFYYGRLPL